MHAEWGFDRKLAGEGIHVMFAGPPGTGKTMAAEVIAGELHLDLYKVDLSQVVSKYIGETEKNLHRIFQEADATNVVLFFDEADALFGKRSEVKDAHDRFANIEISYLLQKMDEYEGVVVARDQPPRNILMRRFCGACIILWSFRSRMRICGFGSGAPFFLRKRPWRMTSTWLCLAREIKLAGRQYPEHRASGGVFAADANSAITMDHIWNATRREHQKLGRSWVRGQA